MISPRESGFIAASALLIAVSLAGLFPSPVRSQPSLAGEFGVMVPEGAASTAEAGTRTAFASGPFAWAAQPAFLALGHRARIAYARQSARIPVEGSHSQGFSFVFPLDRVRAGTPSIGITHRRLRAGAPVDSGLASDFRATLDLATDFTTVGIAWRGGESPDARRGRGWAFGANLHVLESGGGVRLARVDAFGDTTVTVQPGLRDLLFSASIGAVVHESRAVGFDAVWQWRAGAVLRRVGEDTQEATVNLDVDNIATSRFHPRLRAPQQRAALTTVTVDDAAAGRNAMLAEAALGLGFHYANPRVAVRVHGEVSRGLYDDAFSGWESRGALIVSAYDRIAARVGTFSDFRTQAVVFGFGVAVPIGPLDRGFDLGLDLAVEPQRFADNDDGPTLLWTVQLSAPLAPSSEPEDEPEDSLDDLLDDLDDALEDWNQPDGGTR